jgi:5-hydroxyisourate hydrolase
MSISTHVLDTAIGRPAAQIGVRLDRESSGWIEVSSTVTDSDGRAVLVPKGMSIEAGSYRLTFDTGAYFQRQAIPAFYRHIAVEFVVVDAASHHHVPLLLSPFGYSTYRGS